MIVAAIDPGKSGALFLYDPNCGCSVAADVPLLKIRKGRSFKEVPNYAQWRLMWLPTLKIADHVVIELVTGSVNRGGKQGAPQAGMFNFGYAAGFALGLVLESGRPYTLITPGTWKKLVDLTGSDGEASRRMASRLMPFCADLWPLKKHDGRAEAALMAWAGLRVIEGKSSGEERND